MRRHVRLIRREKRQMVACGTLGAHGHANDASMAIQKVEKRGHQPAQPVVCARQLPTVAEYSLRRCSTSIVSDSIIV